MSFFFRNFTRCFVYRATTKPSMWSKSGFEEELVEFAEENGVILVSGRVLAGLDETPSLFGTESR